MRQVKKGVDFFPQTETGGYADKELLSVSILDLGGNVIANQGANVVRNLVKDIEAHSGDLDGTQDVGSLTLTMASGNTLVAGDVVYLADLHYRLVDATDTSITLDKPLESSVGGSNETVTNINKTTTYNVECNVAEVGIVNVVWSHPEMDDRIVKYEIVHETIEEKLEKASAGTRKMVASA